MDAFPSLLSVGDLLAQGVEIAPEQEALVSAPDSRPMVAVWGLPDPQLESGMPYYVDGMPVVVPLVLRNCKPLEDARLPWMKGGTLLDVLNLREDPFTVPTVVGELDPAGDFFMYRSGDFEVMDDHFGRNPWDLWPIDDGDIGTYERAVAEAVNKSCYQELVDYISWENGYDEPADDDHMKYVEDRVLANGQLKDPSEFGFRLHLPPEHQYTWDRLIDLSQQGAQSYGMSLPPEERKSFFRLNGASPWF